VANVPRQRTARFDGDVSTPARARRFVAEALAAWGDDGLSDLAVLVVSELATNAVLHARTGYEVVVSSDHDGVHVAVRDGDERTPAVGQPDDLDVSGRGLVIISRLTTTWGVDARPGGKTVWVALPRSAPVTEDAG
jgi:anti-sigma regulatory factor (Ser/Thr protein kinase)